MTIANRVRFVIVAHNLICSDFVWTTHLPYYCNSFMISFFFFSSRRRHTRCWRDWSSDVCSSDLTAPGDLVLGPFCGSGVAGVGARALDRRFLLGDIDLAYLAPSLAALAPHDAIVARAAVVMEEPAEPPELEALADASAAEDELDAARACGWLDADGATAVLDELLDVRPIEREAAVRRFLRTEPPRPREPDRLRAWRAWALSGRRRS